MKSYCGRRVRIYNYSETVGCRTYGKDGNYLLSDTGKTGRLLEIDVANKHVMIEDEGGNIVKLFYKLVRFTREVQYEVK